MQTTQKIEVPTVYNEEAQYLFNNWSETPFTCKWNGKEQTVEAGQSIQLPEYKAFHFCKHFVDREIGEEGMNMGKRAELEAKTIAPLDGNTDSPALEALKQKIREEESGSMKNGDVDTEEKSPKSEFEELEEEPVKSKAKK